MPSKLSSEVWLALPSNNYPMAVKTLAAWKAQGYMIAILTDGATPPPPAVLALADRHVAPWQEYHGWVRSANYLIAEVVPKDAPVVVVAGDDMYPDEQLRASGILQLFRDRFPDLLGIMQPTGDDLDGTDRICGSPWLGREFIKRVNGGRGCLWHEYFTFYSDEELFEVSRLLGLLWQNPSLKQYHAHWQRIGAPQTNVKAHGYWEQDKELFRGRKAAGFPGHLLKATA